MNPPPEVKASQNNNPLSKDDLIQLLLSNLSIMGGDEEDSVAVEGLYRFMENVLSIGKDKTGEEKAAIFRNLSDRLSQMKIEAADESVNQVECVDDHDDVPMEKKDGCPSNEDDDEILETFSTPTGETANPKFYDATPFSPFIPPVPSSPTGSACGFESTEKPAAVSTSASSSAMSGVFRFGSGETSFQSPKNAPTSPFLNKENNKVTSQSSTYAKGGIPINLPPSPDSPLDSPVQAKFGQEIKFAAGIDVSYD